MKIVIPKETVLIEITEKIKIDFEAAANAINQNVKVVNVNWVEAGLELEVEYE